MPFTKCKQCDCLEWRTYAALIANAIVESVYTSGPGSAKEAF